MSDKEQQERLDFQVTLIIEPHSDTSFTVYPENNPYLSRTRDTRLRAVGAVLEAIIALHQADEERS